MTPTITKDDALLRLGISASSLSLWVKKGLIHPPTHKENRVYYVRAELEDRAFRSHCNDPVPTLLSPPTPYSVLELFAGAGGMALGLENAGLQSKLLVEINKDSVATLRKNRPNWNVVSADVREIDFSEYRDKVNIVAGGFPCQAFSYAGTGRGFEDTRGTLFFEFARCVNVVRPEIALGENVRGLIQHDNGQTLQTMLNTLDEIGYRPAFTLLRAQFLGVPQKRERLVILGVRKDLDYPFLFPREQNYTVSVRQALVDCPPSRGVCYPPRKKYIMDHVREGGYWRDLPVELQRSYLGKSYGTGGGKTGVARRLSWNEPSLTLTCSPAQKQTERCHPSETRPLSLREYARIQTFPDTWEFTGSLGSVYSQIGNAVPPNLAYHIGRSLIGMLTSVPQ